MARMSSTSPDPSSQRTRGVLSKTPSHMDREGHSVLLDPDPAAPQTIPEDRPCDRVCGILTVVERNVLAVGELRRQRVTFHGAGDEQALILRLENQGGEREVTLMAQAGEIEDVLRT